MARFVMLRFEDNKDADAFVESIKGKTVFHSETDVEANKHDVENGFESGFKYVMTSAEATAMWADPTKLCECHPPWVLPNAKNPAQGLQCQPVRSVNYGWLVCSQCKKPHHFQTQHPKNLLVPDETYSNRKYYLGFKADRSDNATETA